jgi:hypothetical protein
MRPRYLNQGAGILNQVGQQVESTVVGLRGGEKRYIFLMKKCEVLHAEGSLTF